MARQVKSKDANRCLDTFNLIETYIEKLRDGFEKSLKEV